MKLSLIIPTFNEEANIRIPLDSAYKIANEVIIVDGGSTDKTCEIAQSYGEKVKIHHVDNPPNFLKNKQRGIEFAQGEWILQLDADEALSPELSNELCKIVQAEYNEKTDPAGYNIPRKNWFLGGYLMKGGVYPDFVTRLYRRDKAHFALKDVHENVIIDGKVAETKHALLHNADPDFERYLMRWNRYTTFEAKRLIEEKEPVGFWSYMFFKPIGWFLKTYFRHRGYTDGMPGFIFSLFSSLRFMAIYVKYWQQTFAPKSPFSP